MTVTLVAAVAANGVIGADGTMPWHLPEDLARFKALTMGHTMIMGRRTYESIGRPLPGRTTVVVTRQPDWSADGVIVVGSVDDALAIPDDDEAFVVGGAEIYRQTLDAADVLEITLIDERPAGDTYFPEVDWEDWEEVEREDHDGFSFVTFHRRSRSADT